MSGCDVAGVLGPGTGAYMEYRNFVAWYRKYERHLSVWEPGKVCLGLAQVVRAALDELGRACGRPDPAVVARWLLRSLEEDRVELPRHMACELHGTRGDVVEALALAFPGAVSGRPKRPKATTSWTTDTWSAYPEPHAWRHHAERGAERGGTLETAAPRQYTAERGRPGGRAAKAAVLAAAVAAAMLLLLLLAGKQLWEAAMQAMGGGAVETTATRIGTTSVGPGTQGPAATPTPARVTHTEARTSPPATSPAPSKTEGIAPRLSRGDLTRLVVGAVVEAINRERERAGVPPARYLNVSVAQWKAVRMLETGLFSHYTARGVIPTYFATLRGAHYGVEENLYMLRCFGGPCISMDDAERYAYDAVRSFVHEDAASMWGHRDSLLDPCNNYVDVGAAWNGTHLFIAVYMASKWVEWVIPPRYAGGRFEAAGIVDPRIMPVEEGERAYFPIFIYRDDIDPAYASRDYYEYGDAVAGVLPPGFGERYTDIQTIYADVYRVVPTDRGTYFRVTFRYVPGAPGQYTLVIMGRNGLGVEWRPMSPSGWARLEWCNVLTYTWLIGAE